MSGSAGASVPEILGLWPVSRRPWTATACLAALGLVGGLACGREEVPSDYDAALARIEAAIEDVEQDAALTGGDPGGIEPVIERVYLLYSKASLTGRFEDLRAVEIAIDEALGRYGPDETLLLVRAYLQFKVHRLDAAMADLARLDFLKDSPRARILESDIALQEGRYGEAREGYERLARERGSWDDLARLAHVALITGSIAEADALYARAAERVSAKEMHSYAWLAVQRGLLEGREQRYEEALAHFRRAEAAYSGYWLVREHTAKVLDVLGDREGAAALYRRVVAETGRPESMMALAAILDHDDSSAAQDLRGAAERAHAKRLDLYPEAAMAHWIEHVLAQRNPAPRLFEIGFRERELQASGSRLITPEDYLHRTRSTPPLADETLRTLWRSSEAIALAERERVFSAERGRAVSPLAEGVTEVLNRDSGRAP